MNTNRDNMPIAFQAGAICSRMAQWGDMNAAFESFPTGTDTTPIFQGLPDNRCQCPHWGFLMKGRIRVKYADHEEVISAGAAYYLPAGHNVVVEESCELVEFSPAHEYQKTLEVAGRNMAVAGNR
jgi:hypothetical protein